MRIALVVVAASLGMLPVETLSSQPVRKLEKPEAEFPRSFSGLAGLRELRDGRVIVSDPQEKTLQVLDFRSGQATVIGREGSGPGEWLLPSGLFPMPGDSTLVQDPPNARFLIIGPDAKPARVFVPAAEPTSSRPRIGGGTIVGMDARGRMYYQGVSVVVGPDGRVTPTDSAGAIRYDPATTTRDTIAHAGVQKTVTSAVQGPGGRVAQRNTPVPFTPADAWAVFPDGRIAIARASDYHVEIVATGSKPTLGPAVSYERVPVTEDEKDAWRKRQSGIRAVINAPPGVKVPALPPLPEPAPWPAVKPPFASGAVFIAPNDAVWVVRSRAWNDSTPVVDVFDSRARPTGQVTLPPGTTLLGFGAKHAYLVRTDDDGLQYLQRYALR